MVVALDGTVTLEILQILERVSLARECTVKEKEWDCSKGESRLEMVNQRPRQLAGVGWFEVRVRTRELDNEIKST
jgi:hypothetical protein